MTKKNKNISFDEISNLLRSIETREETIEFLKSIDPLNDDVKGLKAFLEKNEWDYSKIEAFESKSDIDFESILKQRSSKSASWIKIAAVIAPLIGIGFLLSYFISFDSDNSQKIYSNYYEKEIGIPTLMSVNSDKIFNEAMAAFKDEAYNEALIGFEKTLKKQPQNDTSLYFAACSNMELANNQKAIQQFKKIDSESTFHEKAEYRLAMTYIKSEDFENAKRLLQQVASDSLHPYSEKAGKILKEPAFD